MKRLALALAITLALASSACSAEPKEAPKPAPAEQKQPTQEDYKAYLQALDIRGKALMDSKAQIEALIRQNDVTISKAQEAMQGKQDEKGNK